MSSNQALPPLARGRTGANAPPRALAPSDAPRLRAANGKWAECDWGTALRTFCNGMRTGDEAGSNLAAGWLASPNLTNEELGLVSTLATEGLRLAHGGVETGESISDAKRAIGRTRGSKGEPTGWAVPEESDVVIILGAEAAAAPSALWPRLSCNRRQPRLFALAEGAFDAPEAEVTRYRVRPGSTATLLHGLANILLASGWCDPAQLVRETVGFAQFSEHVGHFTTDRVCTESGLSGEEIWELALAIGTGGRVGFYGEFFSEQATEVGGVLANLALLAGQRGRPGTGVCQARGAFNFLLAGQPGTSLPKMAKAVRAGSLQALWVIATDGFGGPAALAPLLRLIKAVPFVVVQGANPASDLASAGHLFLPSTGWRGKEGTVLDPTGQLRLLKPRGPMLPAGLTDFQIFHLVAQYWGCGPRFARWSSPEATFRLLGSGGGPWTALGKLRDYGEIDAHRPSESPLAQKGFTRPRFRV